jgi:hypothetical protein
MSVELSLAKKLLATIRKTQPTIIRSKNSLAVSFSGQTLTIPLITSQVKSDRSISFR